MTRQAFLGLMLEVSIGTCVIFEAYDEIVFHIAPVFIRRKSTLARGGLVGIICRIIDYETGGRFPGHGHDKQLLTCLQLLLTAVVLSKHGVG